MSKDIALDQAQAVKVVLSQGADKQAKLPLTPMLSKGGNVYWGIPQARGMFGVAVKPPKGLTALPLQVALESSNGTTVAKEVVQLTAATTDDGRPKVSGAKLVTVPQVDGVAVKRLLQVAISVRKDGTWNVKISAIGQGGGGQEAINLFE